jgi:Ni,Fe-hydrogenase III large subunit
LKRNTKKLVEILISVDMITKTCDSCSKEINYIPSGNKIQLFDFKGSNKKDEVVYFILDLALIPINNSNFDLCYNCTVRIIRANIDKLKLI